MFFFGCLGRPRNGGPPKNAKGFLLFSAHCQIWATKGEKRKQSRRSKPNSRTGERNGEITSIPKFECPRPYCHRNSPSTDFYHLLFCKKVSVVYTAGTTLTFHNRVMPTVEEEKKSSRLSLSLFENHRIIF